MTAPAEKYPTRADYMAKRVTHEEFYSAILRTAGVAIPHTHPMMSKVREALALGDDHLNRISLAVWDRLAQGAYEPLRRALKEHGDHYSLAGGVCAMKQAFKEAAERDALTYGVPEGES